MQAVWIYDRTSGDEQGTGQDVQAAVRQTEARAVAMGYSVAGRSWDDGISGSVAPMERPGFVDAVRAVERGDAGCVLVREISRMDRRHPAVASLGWETMRADGVLVRSLKEPSFGAGDDGEEDSAAVLMRFVTFWGSWKEREDATRRTRLAMQDLKEGRRKTKSGKPPGRQRKVTQDQAEEAWRWMQPVAAGGKGLSLREAAHRLSTRNGAFKNVSSKLRRERMVSHQALADAFRHFGLSNKPGRSEIESDQGTAGPVVEGPDGDQAGEGPRTPLEAPDLAWGSSA